MFIDARYYDGTCADSQEVIVELTSSAILITILSHKIKLQWDYEDIKVIQQPYYDNTLVLSSAVNEKARIIICDARFNSHLLKRIKKNHFSLLDKFMSIKGLLFLFMASVVFIIVNYVFLINFSKIFAQNIPQSWEEKLGKYVFDDLVTEKNICKNSAGQKALDKVLKILSSSEIDLKPISIFILDEPEVNAVALPDGKIIIYKKLIEQVDNVDELAGVLAHEIGHIVKKHGTYSLIKTLGLELFLKSMFSDLKSFSFASKILELKYDRALETEADLFAVDILYKSQISNKGFVNFLKKIEKLEHYNESLEILSTHPAIKKRIKIIEKVKKNNSDKIRKILTQQEWLAIKEICKK